MSITYDYEVIQYVFNSPIFVINDGVLGLIGGKSYECMHKINTHAHRVVKLVQKNKFTKEVYGCLVELFNIELESVAQLYPELSLTDAVQSAVLFGELKSAAPELYIFNRMIRRMLFAVQIFEKKD